MKVNHTHQATLLATTLFAVLMTATACVPPVAPAQTTLPRAAQTETGATEPIQTEAVQTTLPQAAQTGTGATEPVKTAEPAGVYRVVTAQEAKQIMDNEPDVTIVDVREPSEYAQGHIPNAMLLTLGSIEQLAATELPDPDALILVYCRSGRRSQTAARALIALGYTNVVDFGGIIDWPYEVVTE